MRIASMFFVAVAAWGIVAGLGRAADVVAPAEPMSDFRYADGVVGWGMSTNSAVIRYWAT